MIPETEDRADWPPADHFRCAQLLRDHRERRERTLYHCCSE
jgi:hypothetical protein